MQLKREKMQESKTNKHVLWFYCMHILLFFVIFDDINGQMTDESENECARKGKVAGRFCEEFLKEAM